MLETKYEVLLIELVVMIVPIFIYYGFYFYKSSRACCYLNKHKNECIKGIDIKIFNEIKIVIDKRFSTFKYQWKKYENELNTKTHKKSRKLNKKEIQFQNFELNLDQKIIKMFMEKWFKQWIWQNKVWAPSKEWIRFFYKIYMFLIFILTGYLSVKIRYISVAAPEYFVELLIFVYSLLINLLAEFICFVTYLNTKTDYSNVEIWNKEEFIKKKLELDFYKNLKKKYNPETNKDEIIKKYVFIKIQKIELWIILHETFTNFILEMEEKKG
ncbi:hypothetical protein [Williamsoniiplasma luminosum]|uniref:Uncharacterized protein n=1 Tax=Williamsoniiplasma luminosum TaxID=214888 RepID=A0A2S0NJA6_9MOLU|nr:hypothetical protein [Williamsoniiplasma luminosum]AVP49103.1 MAG: hypothetical protein C5T88_00690 [Williamsoniiplasma luminosum]